MNQILKPDSTYWDIFEHVETVSMYVETISGLSPAKAALFGFLFLIPLLAALGFILKLAHISDPNKKWWFAGFIILYSTILVYVKIDTTRTFENYALEKRVLNEMVYRLMIEVPAKSLCNSLDLVEPNLSGLSKRKPAYFHYRKNNASKGMFSVVHEKIKAVINQKKIDLEESLEVQEIVSIDSVKVRAQQTGFGIISDQVLKDIISKNDKLIYTDQYRVVEMKKANIVPFAKLPAEAQTRIVDAKFDQSVLRDSRDKYSTASKFTRGVIRNDIQFNNN